MKLTAKFKSFTAHAKVKGQGMIDAFCNAVDSMHILDDAEEITLTRN